ncbi:carboxypeptidase-like regulatory domain-containing protein [Polaribacter gochangensis]|uniref:carboxypeptidase-like regulatory domain-containing protein n=1 Tax=Polaribacter gochangensis TaxID=3252903 RepID=UPI003904D1BB
MKSTLLNKIIPDSNSDTFFNQSLFFCNLELRRNVIMKNSNYLFFKLILSCLLTFYTINFHSYENSNTSFSTFQTSINNFTIQGKVIDKNTGKAIPFCSIVIDGTFTGTSSNELGEFEIKVDTLPAKLIFTHLNYDEQTIHITSNKNLVIQLTPFVHELEEVIISNKKDFYAYELAKKAFRRADVYARNKKYGKAYYRQNSKNGDEYSEFSEIIYDIKYSTEGIDDWDILEGRYALKGGTVNNRNYTLLSRILKSFQQNSEDLIFPLRDNIDHFYNVKVIQKIKTKNGQIAVVSFDPFSKIKTPILKAEAYINIETNELLKLTATLENDDFKAVNFKDENAEKKKYVLTYEMAFKKDSVFDLVMDYMKVDQKFDYYRNDSLKTQVTSTSTLSFFEHYSPDSRKRLGRQFGNNESDWQKLNTIGYNQEFWRENAIVKRTPIEEEVINSFERNSSFESIFFNTRDQISLTQSNISDDIFIQEIEKNILNYNSYKPVEKVYLHTDKDLLTENENLWFSAYVTLGTKHHYSFASKVLYIDLINPKGEIIQNQTIPLEEGRGKGSLKTPKNSVSGDYQIRAYTKWMQNFDEAFFFTKTIKIVSKNTTKTPLNNTNIDLQFFPEGGSIIAEINGRVAFKAIGIDGLGKEVKGKIVDSNNNFISNIKSIENGAGVFNFNPKLGETYTAIVNNDLKFKLPKTQSIGYKMLVSNINPKNIKVKVQATENLRGKKFYVVGHIHNEKYYQGKFEFGGKLLVDFEIPKNKLPTGIFKLTLFSEEGIPMAERAVFVNNNNELNITATIDNSKPILNNKIKVDIDMKDDRNWPVSTGVSISVTDADKFNRKENSTNILTQLLFESDLKGYVENPALFFNKSNRATRYRLELVMLTHGWRNINWKKIKNDALVKLNKHPFEQGIKISGVAKKSGNILLFKKIKMVALSENEYATYTATTNDKGEFTIENFNNVGETKINFNEIGNDGKLIEIDVVLNTTKSTKNLPSNFRSFTKEPSENDVKYSKLTSLNLINDSINKNATLLKEVKIKSTKKYEKKNITNYDRDNMSGYNMVPDHTILTEKMSHGEHLLDVLADIPGLEYIQNRIHIRRNPKPALWIIDGMEVLELPYNMDFANIEKIEILKSVISTAIYGPRGVNGIIIFKTKTAKLKNSKIDFAPKAIINGHSKYTEFYTPKFDAKSDVKSYNEFKTTLYWNPILFTDKDGKATIYFDKPKEVKNLQITIEGLSKYGNPGVLIKTLEEK